MTEEKDFDPIHDDSHEHDLAHTTYHNWIYYVGGMSAIILFYGFLLFFVVGDKGPPIWDYSVVEDVPGESVYSTNATAEFSGLIPPPRQYEQVIRQHVMEPAPKEQSDQERAKR